MSKNRKLITLFVTVMMAVCMCVPAFAADLDSAGNIFEAGNSVSLPDIPFFGGLIAGQTVSADDTDAEGSVMMAGQSVEMNDGEVGESLYAAGNIISIDDVWVSGNIYVAGNNIVIKGSESNGAYVVGNQIAFDGVANALYAAGNIVSVKGTINGDAIIEADVVELDDDLEVTGSLTIKSVNEPKVPDNAPIKDFIYEPPGAMIGCGVISWICIPVIVIALCCTYILAPIGGMLALLYVLLLCAGLAFAGASLVRIFLPNMNVFLSALIGIAVLEVVRMIPFIGTLVGILADMYLLAYVILTLWDNRLIKEKQ